MSLKDVLRTVVLGVTVSVIAGLVLGFVQYNAGKLRNELNASMFDAAKTILDNKVEIANLRAKVQDLEKVSRERDSELESLRQNLRDSLKDASNRTVYVTLVETTTLKKVIGALPYSDTGIQNYHGNESTVSLNCYVNATCVIGDYTIRRNNMEANCETMQPILENCRRT